LDTALDPADVMTTQIVISNDGLTDLQVVAAETFIKSIKYEPNVTIGENLGQPAVVRHTLAVGEKETIQPATFFGFQNIVSNAHISHLDFGIVFKFRPSYWPFVKTTVFRFEAVRASDGAVRLRQKPAGNLNQDYEAFIETERKRTLPR